GCCAECGAPRVRVTESHIDGTPRRENGNYARNNGADGTNSYLSRTAIHGSKISTTTGWRASCSHDAPSVPCIVFDPFGGTSTVGLVAERFGRRWVCLELSADYIKIARR